MCPLAQKVLNCGGKHRATPLSCGGISTHFRPQTERAKAPSPLPLRRRSPRRCANGGGSAYAQRLGLRWSSTALARATRPQTSQSIFMNPKGIARTIADRIRKLHGRYGQILRRNTHWFTDTINRVGGAGQRPPDRVGNRPRFCPPVRHVRAPRAQRRFPGPCQNMPREIPACHHSTV